MIARSLALWVRALGHTGLRGSCSTVGSSFLPSHSTAHSNFHFCFALPFTVVSKYFFLFLFPFYFSLLMLFQALCHTPTTAPQRIWPNWAATPAPNDWLLFTKQKTMLRMGLHGVLLSSIARFPDSQAWNRNIQKSDSSLSHIPNEREYFRSVELCRSIELELYDERLPPYYL